MAQPERIDLTQGDSAPLLEFHVMRVHPTAGATTLDLSAATAIFRMRLVASGGAGPVATAWATANTASGASAGICWAFPSALTASAGQYRAQLIVSTADGTQTAPPDEPYTVVIHARV